MAAYDDRPEARARQAIRRDRSETKAYHAAYRANNKDAIKAYNARPEMKARKKAYRARTR